MRSWKKPSAAFIALIAFVAIVYGRTSKDPGFAVVELFTSEGCSSCPAADQLLARINREYGDRPVFVLAYHVDYWDRLGWKDAFSDAAWTTRQARYRAWLHGNGVYTPQAVVNGGVEMIGSDERRLNQAITGGLNIPTQPIELLATVSKGQARVDYKYAAPVAGDRLYLACVQKGGSSQVKAGENGGRTLNHINIVRSLQSWPAAGQGNPGLSLPAGFNAADWNIVGFIQQESTGHILAAAEATIKTL